MLKRREFVTSALASTLFAPAVARAQSRSNYVVPQDHMPVEVRLKAQFAPYEIHLDPNSFRLYYTQPEGRAIRYSVGVGKPGLYEAGEFRVGAKKEWPAWTPTDEMIERDPASYKKWEDGMPGGPNNPLGARALYLFDGSRDTFLRIHGTGQPWTIGYPVSNGCARLVNAHIIDLYNRVKLGTRVVLYPQNYA